MNDALVGRDVNAAVFLCRRQAEDMVVLIDRAADSAEAVVAVCKRIRNRKLLHAGGPCLLNNADVGDIVREHSIKPDTEILLVAGLVVCL